MNAILNGKTNALRVGSLQASNQFLLRFRRSLDHLHQEGGDSGCVAAMLAIIPSSDEKRVRLRIHSRL
jgi:hypothetical protein